MTQPAPLSVADKFAIHELLASYYDDVVVKMNDQWLFHERMIRDWSGPILRAFPGQAGVKVPRQRPPELMR